MGRTASRSPSRAARARGALLISEHGHVRTCPLPASRPRAPLRLSPGGLVVGRDEADVVLARESESMMTTGTCAPVAVLTADTGLCRSGRQDDAAHPCAMKDCTTSICPLRSSSRSAPSTRHRQSILARALMAPACTLPELVGRPFGHDGNAQASGASIIGRSRGARLHANAATDKKSKRRPVAFRTLMVARSRRRVRRSAPPNLDGPCARMKRGHRRAWGRDARGARGGDVGARTVVLAHGVERERGNRETRSHHPPSYSVALRKWPSTMSWLSCQAGEAKRATSYTHAQRLRARANPCAGRRETGYRLGSSRR